MQACLRNPDLRLPLPSSHAPTSHTATLAGAHTGRVCSKQPRETCVNATKTRDRCLRTGQLLVIARKGQSTRILDTAEFTGAQLTCIDCLVHTRRALKHATSSF